MHRTVPKKISAATFTADGSYAIFADKFGDVHAAATGESATGGPRLLLGHFCSIITDLAASPDGKHIASTDRDSKVRVSLLPKEPLQVGNPLDCSSYLGAPVKRLGDSHERRQGAVSDYKMNLLTSFGRAVSDYKMNLLTSFGK